MSLTPKHLALAQIALLVGRAVAEATPVTWDVDYRDSWIAVAIPNQSATIPGVGTYRVQVRNQTGSGSEWNQGNRFQVDGQLDTDWTDNSITFLTGATNQFFGVNSGNYRPNVASYSGGTANPDGTASG